MQNIKLHEATKEFKISNKLAMFFLHKKNVPVKSHSSVISMEQLELLREFSHNQDKYSKLLEEFKQSASKKKAAPVAVEKTEEKEPKTEQKTEDKKKEEAKPVPEEPLEKPEPEVKASKEKKTPPPKKIPAEKETRIKPPEIREQVKEEPRPTPPVKKRPVSTPPRPVRPTPAPPTPPPPAQRRDHFTRKPPMRRPKYQPRQQRRQGRGLPRRPKPPVVEKKRKELTGLPELIQIPDFITYKELCEKLNQKLKELDERLRWINAEYQSNQILSLEDVQSICQELGVEVQVTPYEDFIFTEYVAKSKDKLIDRPPVVTVMGHVDHGKTTLLDSLRKTRVAEKEAGGITQRIGAYVQKLGGKEIIFIDTPGHEAFTNLRARGAQVTDIVILMVAANEGVKPQTIEAINHAKAAGVPIIVAINKIDMENADANRVKQELSKHDIVVEDWGGDVVSVEISAKQGTNLDALLEMISLVAEMQELKAYGNIPARGTIIESRLDPKLGPVATVLIQNGKLKRGDYFICGNAVGKVKSIFDDQGKAVSNASVPMPVEIMGFEDVPDSGDRFQVVDDFEKAKRIIDTRKLREKENRKDEIIAEKKLSLQNLFKDGDEAKVTEYQLIIKADTYGSSEVLQKILLEQSLENVKVNIVHNGIGHITDGDILLASTASATIIGFNVKAPQKILATAKREQVDIKLYNVIYHLIEDMKKAMKGEVEPEYTSREIGKVEVLAKFKISKIGVVAGCVVREGKVTRKSKIRVMRGDDLVFEGEIETLRRLKDEVSEVPAGTECGIKVKNFNAIEVGDTLEAYEMILKE